jgi:hypothetical protein|tara:strand:+ start:166 stop:402 length:237 start_codon:yes stop_codon:yes gene_type:complete
MPRVTASDVSVELEKHEIQCSERWTQNWNRLRKIEVSVRDLDNKTEAKLNKIDWTIKGGLGAVILILLSGIISLLIKL